MPPSSGSAPNAPTGTPVRVTAHGAGTVAKGTRCPEARSTWRTGTGQAWERVLRQAPTAEPRQPKSQEREPAAPSCPAAESGHPHRRVAPPQSRRASPERPRARPMVERDPARSGQVCRPHGFGSDGLQVFPTDPTKWRPTSPLAAGMAEVGHSSHRPGKVEAPARPPAHQSLSSRGRARP